jgi:hypothetical protein
LKPSIKSSISASVSSSPAWPWPPGSRLSSWPAGSGRRRRASAARNGPASFRYEQVDAVAPSQRLEISPQDQSRHFVLEAEADNSPDPAEPTPVPKPAELKKARALWEAAAHPAIGWGGILQPIHCARRLERHGRQSCRSSRNCENHRLFSACGRFQEGYEVVAAAADVRMGFHGHAAAVQPLDAPTLLSFLLA